MARTRTAAENYDFFMKQADRYELEAKKHITAGRNAQWLKKAADARAHALTYKD